MVKPKHYHHAISVPIGMIVGFLGTIQFVSAQAKDLLEAGETTQACLDIIDKILENLF